MTITKIRNDDTEVMVASIPENQRICLFLRERMCKPVSRKINNKPDIKFTGNDRKSVLNLPILSCKRMPVVNKPAFIANPSL